MSSKWMSKMHALVPLTEQEEQVDGILLQHGITRLTHAIFPVSGRTYVVDFYLPAPAVAVEWWQSTSRRGIALTWVEKNACYIDWKFRRIKQANPDVRCVALVEVAQARAEQVKGYVGPVMEHADAVCYTKEEFASVMREWCNTGD